MSLSQAEPKPGDLIEIFRPFYNPWALYVGDGYVVRLGPPGEIAGAGAAAASLTSALTDKARVKKELLSVVAGTDTYRVNNKHDEKYFPLHPSKIVRPAEELVGQEMPCKLTSENCEHFVNELRYSLPQQPGHSGSPGSRRGHMPRGCGPGPHGDHQVPAGQTLAGRAVRSRNHPSGSQRQRKGQGIERNIHGRETSVASSCMLPTEDGASGN